MTLGKLEAAAAAGASAALVTDFVIAATPPIARAAEATAAYFRNSLRDSSGPSSFSLRMEGQLQNFQTSVNRIKGLSKRRELLGKMDDLERGYCPDLPPR